MARRRTVAQVDTGHVPAELRSRAHPIWTDRDAIAARFPDLVTPDELTEPVMTETDAPTNLRLRRAHGLLLHRWALTNGYQDAKHPGTVAWHRLRQALDSGAS